MTRDEAASLAKKMAPALAEYGYPEVSVFPGVYPNGDYGVCLAPEPPLSVAWTAALIAEPSVMPCWPCYSAHIHASECDHDPWLSERPRLERAP